MDYFDELANARFRTDQEGKIVFHPWNRRRGYVLPDDRKKQTIQRWLKRYHIQLLVTMGVAGVVAAFVGITVADILGKSPDRSPFSSGLFFIGFLPTYVVFSLPMICLYYHRVKSQVKGLPTFDRKQTFKEWLEESTFSLETLCFVEIIAIILIIMGVALIVMGLIIPGHFVDVVVGTICSLLFLAQAIIIRYKICSKRNKRQGN